MRKKAIEKNLKRALLDNGPLAEALFEYELAEHTDEFRRSKREGRIRSVSMSPSSCWPGLSASGLGTDDPHAAALRTLPSDRLPRLAGVTVQSGPPSEGSSTCCAARAHMWCSAPATSHVRSRGVGETGSGIALCYTPSAHPCPVYSNRLMRQSLVRPRSARDTSRM